MGVLSQERALLHSLWGVSGRRGRGGEKAARGEQGGWELGSAGTNKCSPERGEDHRRGESIRPSSMMRKGQRRHRTHINSATCGQCPGRKPAACCPHSEPVRKNGQAARPAERWPLSTAQRSPADANTSSILPFLWGALWFPHYTWAQGSTRWRPGSVLLSGCLYLQHTHTHTHTHLPHSLTKRVPLPPTHTHTHTHTPTHTHTDTHTHPHRPVSSSAWCITRLVETWW